ncbi:MAG: TolC family protein [Sphaerochaetaceae bacterium]
MTKKHVVVVLFLALSIPSLFASQLTLAEAISSAKNNNGTIKVATLELQQSLRNTETNAYLPSLELQAGLSATGSIIDQSFSSTYAVGGVSWSLDSASIATTKQQKELNKATANNTYQSTLNTISSNVTTAYWNVVAATISLESEKNTLLSAQRDLEMVKAKYDAGKATTLAVSQAEVTESDDEYSVAVAKQTLQSAVATLSDLIGRTDDWTYEELPDPITVVPLETLLKKAADTTTIRKYKLLIDSASLSRQTASNTYVSPSVNVSASTKIGGTAYANKTTSPTIADSTTVSVTLSLPLDHFIKSSSAAVALDNAEYDIKIATQNYANELSSLQSSITSAYVSLGQASSNVEKLQKHLALAQEQLALVKASYDAGKSSYSDYQDAVLSVENAKLSILQQKLNYTIALYDLSSLVESDISALQV